MDDPLSFETLLAGARKFAHSAMASHSEEDEETFLLHAGVSIERLAKAALAHKSPFLLMEMKGKDDTLFHLTGVRHTSKLRTIGAAQAIGRLRQMGVLPPSDPELDELIELRNGVAHLSASADETFDGLTVFSRVTNRLLEHTQTGQAPYWGDWSAVVSITLNDLYEKVEREVARRIEQARYRLKNRFEDLPPAALESYVATRPQLTYGLQIPRDGSPSVFLPYDCPACHNTALVVAGPPVLIWKDNPGKSEPGFFICFVCQFTLKSHELAAAGIPSRLPLVDQNGERYLSAAEEVLWHLDPSGSELGEDDPDAASM